MNVCAIHQPQYLAWQGYFGKMDEADVFIFLDDTQFKKSEWQNRNRIRTAAGTQWLTVPVRHHFGQRIDEVQIDNTVPWRRKHLQALYTNYRPAPFFDAYIGEFESLLAREWDLLCELNIAFATALASLCGIECQFLRSSELNVAGASTEALVNLCRKARADTYLSGIGGKDYLQEELFGPSGIRIRYQRFEPAKHRQCFPGFVSNLSIVDVLFNCGPDTLAIIRAGRTGGTL